VAERLQMGPKSANRTSFQGQPQKEETLKEETKEDIPVIEEEDDDQIDVSKIPF